MRQLAAVLAAFVVGCGGGSPPVGPSEPTRTEPTKVTPNESAKTATGPDWETVFAKAEATSELLRKTGEFEGIAAREVYAELQAERLGRLPPAELEAAKTATIEVKTRGLAASSQSLIDTARRVFPEIILRLEVPALPVPKAGPAEVVEVFPDLSKLSNRELTEEIKRQLRADTTSDRVVMMRGYFDLEKLPRLSAPQLKWLQNNGFAWHPYGRAVVAGRDNPTVAAIAKRWYENRRRHQPGTAEDEGAMVAKAWAYLGTLSEGQIASVAAAVNAGDDVYTLVQLRAAMARAK